MELHNLALCQIRQRMAYLAMCLSPIRISKPSIGNSPLRIVRDSRLSNELRSQVSAFSRNSFIVPCGKCVECLKRKQNDLAVRCIRQAKDSGNMIFVTLTYDEDKVPVSCAIQDVDVVTGEFLPETKPLISTNKRVHDKITNQVISSRPRYYSEVDEDFFDDYYRVYTFTPSLDRRDFRLFLKRRRLAFERRFGRKLDFKYVCVGEYGPKTCRPHFHIALFGLDFKDANWIFNAWSDPYKRDIEGHIKYRNGVPVASRDYRGYITLSQVKYMNNDKTFGYVIASKYIGKYMSKGKFDCESVINGIAEKPRICISANFGNSLTQKEIDYFTAQDLFGRYNLNDISHFTESQIHRLCAEINVRCHICVPSKKKEQEKLLRYSLPNSLKKKIFYRKRIVYNEITKKKEIRFEPTQIQSARVALLQAEFLDQCLREFRQDNPNFLAEDFCKYVDFLLKQRKVNEELSRKTQEKDFLARYNQSKF